MRASEGWAEGIKHKIIDRLRVLNEVPIRQLTCHEPDTPGNCGCSDGDCCAGFRRDKSDK
jgi:hypothetical protein